MVRFEKALVSSYRPFILTFPLSLHVSDIAAFVPRDALLKMSIVMNHLANSGQMVKKLTNFRTLCEFQNISGLRTIYKISGISGQCSGLCVSLHLCVVALAV